jgi:hypothetical protein
MDLEKVRAIKYWPSPRSIFEVRSFHGLAIFYRKFIRNSSGICAPILDIVKKRHKSFKLIEEAEKSFKILKDKVTEQPILFLPDFGKTFQVMCDASGVAIGAVLSQDNASVAYFSEKMNDTKKRYSTYDKEFYRVIQALKKCRHYLIPKEFVLYSDNQPLHFITRQDKLNQRHAKWVEFMHNLTFVIKHISSSPSKVADAMSKRCLIMQEFQVETLGFKHLKEMYSENVDFKEAYEASKNPLLRDKSPWMEYLIQDGMLFKGRKLCIPKCLMRDNLWKDKNNGGLEGHFFHDKTFAELSSSYYWPGTRSKVKKFVKKYIIFQYENGRQQNIGIYHPFPIIDRP